MVGVLKMYYYSFITLSKLITKYIIIINLKGIHFSAGGGGGIKLLFHTTVDKEQNIWLYYKSIIFNTKHQLIVWFYFSLK